MGLQVMERKALNAERRKLQIQLQELRGNIRILFRVRPLLPCECEEAEDHEAHVHPS